MNTIYWILLGIILTFLIVSIGYLVIIVFKLNSHKKKIKNTMIQIRGQVDVKFNLLKEYMEINKDSILEDKVMEITDKLNTYDLNKLLDIEEIKTFNDIYGDYMNSFDDSLLSRKCKESDEKIGYIKDYYNELVNQYNNYKSNKVNLVLSKAFSIEDEKLY